MKDLHEEIEKEFMEMFHASGRWGMVLRFNRRADGKGWERLRLEDILSFIHSQMEKAYERGRREMGKELLKNMSFKMDVNEYLKLVEKWDSKNFDTAFDAGYNAALTKLQELIKEKQ